MFLLSALIRARLLWPALAVTLALAAISGGAMWHARAIEARLEEQRAALVARSELSAAQARLARTERALAATRRANAELEARFDGARAEALMREQSLADHAEENPDAPLDCTVGPDLLRRLL